VFNRESGFINIISTIETLGDDSVRLEMKRYSIVLLVIIFIMIGVASSVSAEPVFPPKRIVSLAPSMTEILYALGLGENIVGVTSYCDYPEAAKAKPKIGGMSNPSLEAVILLRPDLVVMTTDGNAKEVEERLRSLKIATYVFTARRISELPRGIKEVGAALGVPKRAKTLAQEIEKALTQFGGSGMAQKQNRPLERRGSGNTKKKVLFIVWPDPLIVAGPGTAMDDAIVLLGYENIAKKARTVYPKYSLEEVIRQSPDVIAIGKASGMDMRAVTRGFLQRMESVPAVKNGAVCYMSDSLYRLGPRVVHGIEELSACLQ
jgi:iron complex transport system substrate-binding protein